MDNNREEFFHVILGPNSHFEYEYNDVKEIFARVYMAYDYFRADSESAMDFHNKYPDYEKFTPLPDNELVEEVNDLERLKISSGADKQNVVERYQLNKVNDMLGVYHPISELIDISESEVITTDNVDEFMKELDLLVDPGLCR